MPRPPLTTEQFVAAARERHGDVYDYSAVKVVRRMKSPVTIFCPNHGPFLQTFANHLRGGCSKCSYEIRGRRRACLSAERFVSKARTVHGTRYSYDHVVYSGSQTAVTITCERHGDFQQAPTNHLGGAGCSACAMEARTATFTTVKDFLLLSRRLHGDRYEYHHVSLRNTTSEVTVTCRVHGDFSQVARQHAVLGQGCPSCRIDATKMTAARFIEDVRGRYDIAFGYAELPEHVTARSRIWVVCPYHGRFQVSSAAHRRGAAGCPACGRTGSRFEREIARLIARYGIGYEREWTHPTLKDRNVLRFDFALPSQRVLIEYDGAFHFRTVMFPGELQEAGDLRLAETKRRDRIKTDWARTNGWRLVRISSPNRIEKELIARRVLPSTARKGASV